MDTATFNSQSLGDRVLSVSAGNIERTIVDQQLLRNDAHFTLNQGGGKQTITVTAYRECSHFAECMTYVETLSAACGNAKATLSIEGVGGTKTWTNCLLVGVREDETDGSYTRFTMTFVRSLN